MNEVPKKLPEAAEAFIRDLITNAGKIFGTIRQEILSAQQQEKLAQKTEEVLDNKIRPFNNFNQKCKDALGMGASAPGQEQAADTKSTPGMKK